MPDSPPAPLLPASELPPAFYEPDGDVLHSTGATRGPWDPALQHAGPPSALLARAIEAAGAIGPGQPASLHFDILRPVPVAPLRVTARILRPGRRVEQVEATLTDSSGEPLMRCTAWRLRARPQPLPDGRAAAAPPPPGREDGPPADLRWWRGPAVGYHTALEWRMGAGDFVTPGPATAWTRLRLPLVAGEAPTPLERLIVMADAASGISAELPWDAWLFINVDLGIHLERPPEGEWMAMAARTRLGPLGAAQTTSVLYDEHGRVGTTTQALLVAER
jgi:hypothetical protein